MCKKDTHILVYDSKVSEGIFQTCLWWSPLGRKMTRLGIGKGAIFNFSPFCLVSIFFMLSTNLFYNLFEST